MNGDRQTYVKRILKAIENGTLLPDETERRLCALIEEEVTRTDARPDEEYMSACIALWEELHGKTDAEYEARAARLRLSIDDAIRVREKHRRLRGWGFKALIATAAMIVLLVGIGIPLRWVWFEHWSTPDEQQHVIMGHEITVDMVEKAIADRALHDTGTVVVEDVSQISSILGFDLHIPEVLADRWDISNCCIDYPLGYIKIAAMYADKIDSSKRITCLLNIYTDVEMAYFSFEQTRDGKLVECCGQNIYVSDNLERTSACWYNNVMYVCITGDLDGEESAVVMTDLIGGTYE